MRLPGSEGVFLGASRRDRTPLKFTPKRRILILQTNLSFGFALTHCGETRRNEWAQAHFSFGQDAAKLGGPAR